MVSLSVSKTVGWAFESFNSCYRGLKFEPSEIQLGVVAKWIKAAVCKTVPPERAWVRIPPTPLGV